MFKKVLVANRGEIAVRVIRACRELGLSTVAVYSEADRESLAVRMADESVCIGPPMASKSYLSIHNIMKAAGDSGADAIHPGYGFLAENPALAAVCVPLGLTFIGPSAEAIEAMGIKTVAREKMRRLGVPVVPGSEGEVKGLAQAENVAEKIGYPLMVKAAGGGGGRGIRIVAGRGELASSLESAQNEARSSFGTGDVYLEKFLRRPRHVEIQVLADGHGNTVALGERESSLQRRRQKLLEEAPSVAVDERLRARMQEAAVQAARGVGYRSAGTVEFLLDGETGDFYFIEMNTRIQVEHPCTEMVTGVDIVKEQLAVAAGGELSIRQEDVRLNGWAIECRINAEDPERDFRPCPGVITAYEPPGGPGIRVDAGFTNGSIIPPYYDSLIAKLVAWGRNREEAIARMERALGEFQIGGVTTTIPLHAAILREPAFRAGRINTNFLEEEIIPELKLRASAV